MVAWKKSYFMLGWDWGFREEEGGLLCFLNKFLKIILEVDVESEGFM